MKYQKRLRATTLFLANRFIRYTLHIAFASGYFSFGTYRPTIWYCDCPVGREAAFFPIAAACERQQGCTEFNNGEPQWVQGTGRALGPAEGQQSSRLCCAGGQRAWLRPCCVVYSTWVDPWGMYIPGSPRFLLFIILSEALPGVQVPLQGGATGYRTLSGDLPYFRPFRTGYNYNILIISKE